MKRSGFVALTWTLAVALTACGQLGLGGRSERAAGGERPGEPALLFSPNAEPLADGLACGAAMAAWFDRVDANHDGRLDRREFTADSDAQFERMDLDHDGVITADELSRYRSPVAKPGESDGAEPVPVRLGGGIDPVMSADSNLDFKVSRAEFLKQASDIFDHLDSDHGGTLDLAEVGRFCAAAPAGDPNPAP